MKRREFIKTGLGAATLLASPLNLYSKQGKMCIVINGADSSRDTASQLETLAEANIPITVSVSINSDYQQTALGVLSKYSNAEIFLNLPTYESDDQRYALWFVHYNVIQTNKHLLSILHSDKTIKGINNNTESNIAEREDIIKKIAKYCRDNDLILLESMITSESLFYKVGKEIGATTYKVDDFIDEDPETKLINHYEKTKQGNNIILVGNLEKNIIDALIKFPEKENLVRISQL